MVFIHVQVAAAPALRAATVIEVEKAPKTGMWARKTTLERTTIYHAKLCILHSM
jgi:hypothetical protein